MKHAVRNSSESLIPCETVQWCSRNSAHAPPVHTTSVVCFLRCTHQVQPFFFFFGSRAGFTGDISFIITGPRREYLNGEMLETALLGPRRGKHSQAHALLTCGRVRLGGHSAHHTWTCGASICMYNSSISASAGK